jgi:penicillin-binding protein 1A
MPGGMTQVWIDPATGVKAMGGEAAIYEAFKPGTGPNLVTSVIGVDSNAFMNIENQQGVDGQTDQNTDFSVGRGGLF